MESDEKFEKRNECVFLTQSKTCENPNILLYCSRFCPFEHNSVDQELCSGFANIMEEENPITNPSHYKEGRLYEPRKVIRDWGLNFNLGNAVKYISRAGRKGDAVEDLKKAIQYINFELEELNKGGYQNGM